LLFGKKTVNFCVPQVAIVGGGLAGLATAHHLLSLSPSIRLTIYDPRSPGKAEASSVAGMLLFCHRNLGAFDFSHPHHAFDCVGFRWAPSSLITEKQVVVERR
jgi:glycine/D-amino acid oxidase-like deaminating enzyme